MDKCSCGTCCTIAEYDKETESWLANTRNILVLNFCPYCGSQRLPDGRVIQRETVPNRLMSMLKDVQATCPESGLQEFALKYLNLIHDLQVKSGLDEHEMLEGTNIRPDFPYLLMNNPRELTLEFLIVLLNTATKKAQEAKQ